ncbi:gamma-tubulin complex component 5 isoform X2 [Hydra vulgaris]|uniref:Gamma-tubulin complex component n=1 Tax=Hydra vulgaris TaxID=6087 RepID=A0ABM4BTL5_HYDVU
MAPITLKKSIIDDYTEELIFQTLNLKKKDENFKTAFEFVMSNFRFHRFLDVNPLDISRNISGLCKKLCINCQDMKALHLKELVEKFLNQPLLSAKDENFIQTDAHYSLLFLLLCLSTKPLSTAVKLNKEIVEIENEHFDWKKYLYDEENDTRIGASIDDTIEEVLNNSDDDTWILYEENNEEEESNTSEHSFEDNLQIQVACNVMQDSETLVLQNKVWLKENMCPIYWDETEYLQYNLTTKYYSSSYRDMCNNWEIYLKSECKSQEKSAFRLINEIQLVRETLWMIQGIKNLYIYNYKDGKYHVNKNIAVTHLSQETLLSFLSSFIMTGNRVVELIEFTNNFSIEDGSKTFAAFAYVNDMFLKKRREMISDLEKTIIDEDKTLTLAILKEKLTKDHHDILCIHKLYTDTIVQGSLLFSTVTERVVFFMDVFYECLSSLDLLGDACLDKFSMILAMFLDVCQSYLQDLDQWMTIGKLPHNSDEEFMICSLQASKKVEKDEENYWRATYQIKETKSSNGNVKSLVPKFIEGIQKQILVTGKSLGLLAEFGDFSSLVVETSLHEEFRMNLIKELQQANDRFLKVDDGLVTGDVTDGSSIGFEDPLVDHLVQQNFNLMFGHAKQRCIAQKYIKNNQRNEGESWSELLKNGACRPPIKLLIQKSLFPGILKRYDRVCKLLLDLFKEEFSLHQHFQVMKNFFLMEDGGTMHEFCIELFQKAKEKTHWQDKPFLNIVLQDALQRRHLHLIGSLSVELQPHFIAASNSDIFDGMSLHYKAPWPVTIILNAEAEQKYNEIFRFLLKVKRTMWTLEQLKFQELINEPSMSQSHQSIGDTFDIDVTCKIKKDDSVLEPIKQKLKLRMLIFRMKMMHVIRNFHFYLVSRIQNTTCAEFDAKLKEAKDLDKILEHHETFLLNLKQRCLLREKIGRSRDAIFRILSLVFDFESLWMRGLVHLDENKLNSLEIDFNRCAAFLHSFFNSLAKRGSYPHFEFLANALKIEAHGHQYVFRR